MTTSYLQSVLDAQAIENDSLEMRDLRAARQEVEQIIRSAFSDCSPTIRYGGSKIKGTMNLVDYDLDIPCYFPRDDTPAGKSIAEIYYNVARALEPHYHVEFKTAALKLLDGDRNALRIDVVPGRFIDDTQTDVFLHQHDNPGKEYLKTNLDEHIDYICNSGCIDDIRLGKLWRPAVGIDVKTFPLELLVIEVLKGSGITGLESRFEHFLERVRDNIHSIGIEDPANPNNDMSHALSFSVRETLSDAAADTLRSVAATGWEPIFDDMIHYSPLEQQAALHTAIITNEHPTPPWADD